MRARTTSLWEPAIDERTALTIGVIGWYSANGCIQPAMVLTGTNVLNEGRDEGGHGHPLGCLGVGCEEADDHDGPKSQPGHHRHAIPPALGGMPVRA